MEDEDMTGDLPDDVHIPPATLAAWDWWKQLFTRGLDRAWPATDPDLRLAFAQEWIWEHRTDLRRNEVDGIAAALAHAVPEHPLWPELDASVTQLLKDHFENDDALGTYTVEEPLGPDLVQVYLVPGDVTPGKTKAGEPVALYPLVMRLAADGTTWRVAGIGRGVAVPGWPPQRLPVS